MLLNNAQKVAAVIHDAGGRIVGRTRLQKVTYLLTVVGFEDDGLRFVYKHYGPFSEEIADATHVGRMLGHFEETEQQTEWGGTYSIYTVNTGKSERTSETRQQFTTLAAQADAIELELAATAVYLAINGDEDPWTETSRRKPEKAESGRIDRARELVRKLAEIETPRPLPRIA